MTAESAQQIKQLTEARDLLCDAVAQYRGAINALHKALRHAESALSALGADVEAVKQELFALTVRLPQGALEELEAFQALAETLEVLASEVTVREEHVPAGAS